MTTHYVDLRVVPDPEFSTAQLLGALYDRLHLALVQQRLGNIGVSFPGYSLNPRALGNVLRLHGGGEILQDFLRTDWLKGMRDHTRLSEIAPAPADTLHRTVQRRQFKTNADRLRRRRMRRKGETEQQAADAIPGTVERRPNLPYVHLRSRSTGQPFCLFIALGPPVEEAIARQFNSYGLSGTATVPWF
ncbi:type I-F CRISPR-associated endoribonuclease Cas6/Csy4 [Luteimonas sp. XNQY3]|nr:type I-F CRISPR-associated endoribonuclease Cas6/Csy4 [Luteimonas sp. XNQY3]MCD9004939.1 type I-F CRISPR-associated endoribonuclease Cas6/Csy4 [Luteimonas sp. XNQY3]